MSQANPIGPAKRDELVATVGNLQSQWDRTALHDFCYLPGGYSNDNYRFRYADEVFVLRRPRRPDSDSHRTQERALYQVPGDLLIPALVAMDPNTGTMISKWVSGPLLSDSQPGNAQLLAYAKHLLANLAAHSHMLVSTYDPVALSQRQLATVSQPVPAVVSRHLQQLVWLPGQTTVCHNDLNPWNVIATSDDVSTWVTLDWECPGPNDPLFDLVTLHQGLNRDMHQLESLAAQLLEVNVNPQRVTDNLRGFWLREYCWAFAAWHRGDQRAQIGEQMALAEGKLSALPI